jgi:putative transposase
VILTYKYRIKDWRAKKRLTEHAKAVNQVWNWCNAQQQDTEARYKAGAPKRKWLSRFDFNTLCKGVGFELGINQHTVQEICRQYAESRDKAKHSVKFRSSFGAGKALGWVPFTPQSRQLMNNSITYLGYKYRWFGSKDRPLPDNAKGGAFVEDSLGRWYVTFYVEVEQKEPGTGMIGIDLGLKTLATYSDGTKIEAPQHYRTLEPKLKVAQRAGKTTRVKAIHLKIANRRRDELHKVTTDLVRSNALIAVGNVNAKQLGQTRMAKSVYDAGWSTFRNMLRYKSAGYVEVDERFTTQTCSDCGALPDGRPKGIAGLGIRDWVCSDCGTNHDRDVNAARNILNAARSVTRLAEGSRCYG